MRSTAFWRAVCLFAVTWTATAQKETPAALLAKAAAAFERNLSQEKHWSWTTTEHRIVSGRDGQVVQQLPTVIVESVIRSDSRRCVAVLSWGDGVAPYALNADAEARCSDLDELRTPFKVESLLKSAKVKLVERSAAGVTLAIQPDKSRLYAEQHDVRCTASIRATVRLDAATFFPILIEGEVAESGCEVEAQPELHYGEEPLKQQRLQRMLRKGTTFRMNYALQQDKFGNPGNSFWIAVEQHWSRPFLQSAKAVIFWNRRFDLSPAVPDRRLVQSVETVAQEFGVASETRFDIPKLL
jgi:hypothetical protein